MNQTEERIAFTVQILLTTENGLLEMSGNLGCSTQQLQSGHLTPSQIAALERALSLPESFFALGDSKTEAELDLLRKLQLAGPEQIRLRGAPPVAFLSQALETVNPAGSSDAQEQ